MTPRTRNRVIAGVAGLAAATGTVLVMTTNDAPDSTAPGRRRIVAQPSAPSTLQNVTIERTPDQQHPQKICALWFRDVGMLNSVGAEKCVITGSEPSVTLLTMAPDLRDGGWVRVMFYEKIGENWTPRDIEVIAAKSTRVEIAP